MSSDQKNPRHLADFVRVTEHGSEFFRVTCRETGAQAMHWPEYLRPGDVLTIWGDGYHPCAQVEHVNAKRRL